LVDGIPLQSSRVIIRDYGMLGFGGITPIMQRQKKNHRVPPDQMVCHYTLLCAIISDYFTIISIIAII
jgi:hypothetical protein